MVLEERGGDGLDVQGSPEGAKKARGSNQLRSKARRSVDKPVVSPNESPTQTAEHSQYISQLQGMDKRILKNARRAEKYHRDVLSNINKFLDKE